MNEPVKVRPHVSLALRADVLQRVRRLARDQRVLKTDQQPVGIQFSLKSADSFESIKSSVEKTWNRKVLVLWNICEQQAVPQQIRNPISIIFQRLEDLPHGTFNYTLCNLDSNHKVYSKTQIFHYQVKNFVLLINSFHGKVYSQNSCRVPFKLPWFNLGSFLIGHYKKRFKHRLNMTSLIFVRQIFSKHCLNLTNLIFVQ